MSLQESNRQVMLESVLAQMGEDITYGPSTGPAVIIFAAVEDSQDWRDQNPGAWYGVQFRLSALGSEPARGDEVTVRGETFIVSESPDHDGVDWRRVKLQLPQR